MRRFKLRKTVIGITCTLSIFATLTMCACSKGVAEKIDNGTDDYSAKEQDTPGGVNNEVFDMNVLNFAPEDELCLSSFYYKDGYIYYATNYGDSADMNSHVYDIHRYDIEEQSDEKLVSFTEPCYGDGIYGDVSAVKVDDFGNIILFYNNLVDHQDDMMVYRDIKKRVYGQDGNSKSEIILESVKAISVDLTCFADNEGNSYVGSTNDEDNKVTWYHYNQEGKLVNKVQPNGYTSTQMGYLDNSGRLLVRTDNNEKSDYGVIDFENEKIDKSDFTQFNSEVSALFVGEYKGEYLMNTFENICTYNTESGELKSVLNLKKNNLDSNSILYFNQMDDDKYICVNENSTGSSRVEFIVLQKSSGEQTKQSIVMAGAAYDCDITDAINEFNRKNDAYRIEYVNYSDSETPAIDMMRDIMTGKAPDIYLVNGMDSDNLIKRNMLCDLTPYIEKDDILNNDYFTEGYLDSTEVDGKHYFMMKQMQICALVGKADDLEAYKYDWSIDDLIKYYNSKPKGTMLLNDSSPMNILDTLISSDMDSYIDWTNATCHFDSERFKKLLKFCYDVKDYNDDEAFSNSNKYIKEGKILFNVDSVKAPSDIQMNDELFGNAAYMGYMGGIYLQSGGSSFAVSATSEQQDAAWSVIKEFMTGSYRKYDVSDLNKGIPTSREEFEQMVKGATATEKYNDANGVERYPQSITYGAGLTIGPSSEADISKIKELISKAKYINKNDTVMNLITEDVQDYFDGKKKLDNVVKVIQDKVSKYVSENA